MCILNSTSRSVRVAASTDPCQPGTHRVRKTRSRAAVIIMHITYSKPNSDRITPGKVAATGPEQISVQINSLD